MTKTPIDSPGRLRELAARRRKQTETSQALRIPLVLDQDAADKAEGAKRMREGHEAAAERAEQRFERDAAKMQMLVDDLDDALADRDDSDQADAADVRGDGSDTTGLGQRAAAAQEDLHALEAAREEARATEATELDRLREAEREAREEARAGIGYLVFTRIPSAAYEQLLVQHGGAQIADDPLSERPFLDALLAASFLRIEYPDGGQEQIRWADVLSELQPSQGELGHWRLMCFTHQARAGVDVPFA